MGFDVYGKNPQSEVGKYFRNNVWWWRGLWDYCCNVGSSVISKALANSGQMNDGKGLSAKKSLQLAKILEEEDNSGRLAAYELAYKQAQEQIADEDCHCCGGTGKRLPPPFTGPGTHDCNGCNNKGKVRPWAAQYPFSAENVKEFAAFLKDCGGFEIC
jgi:hypothetical protein